jgi:hypothetical protein
MAPPSATEPLPSHSHSSEKAGVAPLEPGIDKREAADATMRFPRPPTFEDKYKEREYQKGRLALAFRIFAKLGFDEGVAGHITLRVRTTSHLFSYFMEMLWVLGVWES